MKCLAFSRSTLWYSLLASAAFFDAPSASAQAVKTWTGGDGDFFDGSHWEEPRHLGQTLRRSPTEAPRPLVRPRAITISAPFAWGQPRAAPNPAMS